MIAILTRLLFALLCVAIAAALLGGVFLTIGPDGLLRFGLLGALLLWVCSCAWGLRKKEGRRANR